MTINRYKVEFVRSTKFSHRSETKTILAGCETNAMRTMLQLLEDRTQDVELLYRQFSQDLFKQNHFNAHFDDGVAQLEIQRTGDRMDVDAFVCNVFPPESVITLKVEQLKD